SVYVRRRSGRGRPPLQYDQALGRGGLGKGMTTRDSTASRGHPAPRVPVDARLFAHPRLEIAGAIARQAGVSFRLLCDELELSDGNLSAHLRALENEAVISVERTFDGRRRLSQYRLTEARRGRSHDYVPRAEQLAHALHPHVLRGC